MSINKASHQHNEPIHVDALYDTVSPKDLGYGILESLHRKNPNSIKQLGSFFGYQYEQKKYGGEERYEAIKNPLLGDYIKDHFVQLLGYYFLIKANTNEEYKVYVKGGQLEKYIEMVASSLAMLSPIAIKELVENIYKLTEYHFDRKKNDHNGLSALVNDSKKDIINIFDIKQSLHALPSKGTLLQKITDNKNFEDFIILDASSISLIKKFKDNKYKTNFDLFQTLSPIDKSIKNRIKITSLLPQSIPSSTNMKYSKKVYYSKTEGDFNQTIVGEGRLKSYEYGLPQKVFYETVHAQKYGTRNIETLSNDLNQLFENYRESLYDERGVKKTLKDVPSDIIDIAKNQLIEIQQKYAKEEDISQTIGYIQNFLKKPNNTVIHHQYPLHYHEDTGTELEKAEMRDVYIFEYDDVQVLIEEKSLSLIFTMMFNGQRIPYKQIQILDKDGTSIQFEHDTENIRLLKSYLKRMIHTNMHTETLQKDKLEASWLSLNIQALLQIYKNWSEYEQSSENIFLTLINEFPREYKPSPVKSDLPTLKSEYIVANYDSPNTSILGKLELFFPQKDQIELTKKLNIKNLKDMTLRNEDTIMIGGRNNEKKQVLQECLRDINYFWNNVYTITELDIEHFEETNKERLFVFLLNQPYERREMVSRHYAINFFDGISQEKKEVLMQNYIATEETKNPKNPSEIAVWNTFLPKFTEYVQKGTFDKAFFLSSLVEHKAYFNIVTQLLKGSPYPQKIKEYVAKITAFIKIDRELYKEKGYGTRYYESKCYSNYFAGLIEKKVKEKDEHELPITQKILKKREAITHIKKTISPIDKQIYEENKANITKLKNKLTRTRNQIDDIKGKEIDESERDAFVKKYQSLALVFLDIERKKQELETLAIQKGLIQEELAPKEKSLNIVKGNRDFWLKKWEKSHTPEDEEMLNQVIENFKNVQEKFSYVKNKLEDVKSKIQSESSDIVKLKKSFIFFPTEYKAYLRAIIKDLETQKETSEKSSEAIMMKYTKEFASISSIEQDIDRLDKKRSEVDQTYTKEINALIKKSNDLHSRENIQYTILAPTLKLSGEYIESIKEDISSVGEDILLRILVLYIVVNQKYDTKIGTTLEQLKTKSPNVFKDIIERLIQHGYFIDFFIWLSKINESLAKELLAIWVENQDNPIEELVSLQLIETRLQIKHQRISYEKISQTHNLVKIIYGLGVLDEIKGHTGPTLPPLFTKWFGENRDLYRGIKMIIQKASSLYYKEINDEMNDSIIQKVYR